MKYSAADIRAANVFLLLVLAESKMSEQQRDEVTQSLRQTFSGDITSSGSDPLTIFVPFDCDKSPQT